MPTTEVPGTDTIEGGAGNDIIFGDHGIVTQAVSGLLGTGGVNRIETTNEAAGLDDTIEGGTGDDRIFGGLGADAIEGTPGTTRSSATTGSWTTSPVMGTTPPSTWPTHGTRRPATSTRFTETPATTRSSAVSGPTCSTEARLERRLRRRQRQGYRHRGLRPDHLRRRVVSATETIDPGQGANDTIEGNEDNDILMAASEATRSTRVSGTTSSSVTTPGSITIRGRPEGPATTDTAADSSFGDADTITAGDGDKVILGGMGADIITTSVGTDVILGDNGTVTYAGAVGSLKLSQIVSTVPSRGGNDVITAGNGTKHIMGGYGSATIRALAGDHDVIGDNGRMTFDTTGMAMTLETTDTEAAPGYGGNDTITAGDGVANSLGGMGADLITVGSGRGILFGDNGEIRYTGAAGHLKAYLAVSLLPASGGDDRIVTAGGNKHVIGGYGSDTITTAGGDDILIGDNGEIRYESGIPSLVRSIDPHSGGNDLLKSGSGVDILIGGTAGDDMYGGEDNDVLIGDGGQVTLTSGEWLYVETIDHHSGGGDDYLDSGSGDDIMFGGEISNTFVGTLGQDVMVGTYGRVTITAGKVQSLVRLDSIDLITNTMTSLEDGTNAESQPLWTSGAGTGGQAGAGGTEGGGATGGTGGAGFGSYFSTGSTLPGVWVATSYGTELMRLGDADLSQEDDGHSDSQAGSQGGSSGDSGSGRGRTPRARMRARDRSPPARRARAARPPEKVPRARRVPGSRRATAPPASRGRRAGAAKAAVRRPEPATMVRPSGR